jgi:hypothetical protein
MAEFTKPPKVFISYAWEDDVKAWVLDFATRLRADGIDVVLDLWEIAYGDQITEFMEKAVRNSDFVILICTPKYKRKSDERAGGVGYEGHIITAEISSKNNHRKFIPVLRKGKWTESSPSWALGKAYIDLSSNPYKRDNYSELLNTLYGKRGLTPPPLGNPPNFGVAKKSTQKPAYEQKSNVGNLDYPRTRSSVSKYFLGFVGVVAFVICFVLAVVAGSFISTLINGASSTPSVLLNTKMPASAVASESVTPTEKASPTVTFTVAPTVSPIPTRTFTVAPTMSRVPTKTATARPTSPSVKTLAPSPTDVFSVSCSWTDKIRFKSTYGWVLYTITNCGCNKEVCSCSETYYYEDNTSPGFGYMYDRAIVNNKVSQYGGKCLP